MLIMVIMFAGHFMFLGSLKLAEMISPKAEGVCNDMWASIHTTVTPRKRRRGFKPRGIEIIRGNEMTIGEEGKKRIYSIPRTNEVLSRDGYGEHRGMTDIRLNDACGVCGVREVLHFKCSYCGGTFCGEHHIPEKHECTYGIREVHVTEEMLAELEAKKSDNIVFHHYCRNM